jgi:hypothetical protein
MDYADVEIRPGFRIRISAENFSEKYQGKKLYCPLCGGPVIHIPEGERKTYFRHDSRFDIDQSCENYISNYSSDYTLKPDYLREKSGLPFYIEKIGNNFQLYLGLPKLTQEELDSVYDNLSSIEVTNGLFKHITNIEVSNIQADCVYLEPIDRIDEKYHLKYNDSVLLHDKWGSETLGIFSEGTFFQIHKDKSQKISYNGKITIDTNYYFMIRDSNIQNRSFLEIKEKYPVITEISSNWVVCRVSFTELTSQAYNFADKCHVRLAEKQSEYVPLWPPMIQHDSVNNLDNEKTTLHILNHPSDIYCKLKQENSSLKSDNSLFGHVDKTQFKFPAKLEDNVVDTTFNVDTRYKKPKYHFPDITIKWHNKPTQVEPKMILPLKTKKRDLSLSSDVKCNILHLNKEMPKEFFIDKESLLYVPYIENNDKVIILHGQDILTSVTISRKSDLDNNDVNRTISDETLYSILKKNDENYISFPIQLKYILPKFAKYPKSFECLKMMMKSGKIMKRTEEYLLTIYNNGGY